MSACEHLLKLGLRSEDCQSPPATMFESIVPVFEDQGIHPPVLGQPTADVDDHLSLIWYPIFFALLLFLIWLKRAIDSGRCVPLLRVLSLLRLRRERIERQRTERYNVTFPFDVKEAVSGRLAIQEPQIQIPPDQPGSCVINIDY